ncbi:MAG: regulatory protein RecX [Alistipes sp.]
MLSPKIKRSKTPEQALSALMRLCARAEKSTGDALRLMRTWGVDEAKHSAVLQQLLDLHFIDDTRFAEAFVRDKTKFSNWGAFKIRAALQHKGIDKQTIDNALIQISKSDMDSRLTEHLTRKVRTIKYTTTYELKTKLIRYGLSLGYDYEAVMEAVAKQINNTEECDDFI